LINHLLAALCGLDPGGWFLAVMRRFLFIVVTAKSPGNRDITGKTGQESTRETVLSALSGGRDRGWPEELGGCDWDVDSGTGKALGNRSAFTWGHRLRFDT
jgi:hypothetical protein